MNNPPWSRIEKGEVCLVPLSEWPEPGRSERNLGIGRHALRRRIIEMAYRGYADATEEELRFPPLRARPLVETRADRPLSFVPAKRPLSGILVSMSASAPRAAQPQATRLQRVYDHTPAIRVVLVVEHDYVSDKARITVPSESVNAAVCEWPARLQVLLAPSGRLRSSLSWWTPQIMYSLTIWSAEITPEAATRTLSQSAAQIMR